MSTVASPEVLAKIRDRARLSRAETVRLISIAKTGHYASSFSSAEILATLYYGVLRLRPDEPDWADRDRFLFGKGHAATALYPLLADLGFFDRSLLDQFTRLGNPLGDHPDSTRVPGIDFSSGSLGHALSGAVGMALGGRIDGRTFRIFVLLGDGECNEGQVWEAAMAAAHHGLGNIVAIVDRNEYSLDGKVDDVTGIEPLADKFRAFGWDVSDVDGHNVAALYAALSAPHLRPSCVIAHTVKGKGVALMEEQIGWHLGYLAPVDARRALNEIRSTP